VGWPSFLKDGGDAYEKEEKEKMQENQD